MAIEAEAQANGALFTARVHDRTVTDAMIAGKSVVDITQEGAAADLAHLWDLTRQAMDSEIDERIPR